MRRRDLIKGIAGSAAAWPLAAHVQQSALGLDVPMTIQMTADEVIE